MKNLENNKWANVAQSRFGELVETYPERLTDVISAKGDSKMSQGVEYVSNQDILVFYFSYFLLSQIFTFFFHFDIRLFCVDRRPKMTIQSILTPLCNNKTWKRSRGVNTF